MLKKFNAWFLKKKAEVEKVFYPKVIEKNMLGTDSYMLENGHELELHIATTLDVEDIMEIQESAYGGKAPWSRLTVYNELRNPHSDFLLLSQYGEGLAFIALAIRKNSLHIT